MERFAYGVDFGWVSQLEARGIHWVDKKGDIIDPYKAVKDMGADSVRLRVFVDPPKKGYWQKRDGTVCMLGFCDAGNVLSAARRVKENKMRLMVGFHYSDHFADPQYQEIPAEWLLDNNAMLKKRIYNHTREVLELLYAEGIVPEWVQVGNEINPGILLPKGSLAEHPAELVEFLNAGYEAVKAVSPDIQVITHLARIYDRSLTKPFLDNFFAHGGKTDILGLSYYPYWAEVEWENGETKEKYVHNIGQLKELLKWYQVTYQKPVMIVEVGGREEEPAETRGVVSDTVSAVRSIPDGNGLGVFYWEPEVGKAVLPDAYPLGAAECVGKNTLRFTDALLAYREA